ncbi:competence protein ComK [Bacillus sp. REN10]|uniref:competence protein ComK n=1 Tax=Bacillus sp. REN10 TaxID=2782541 RepID=UPI00193C35B3|nr:competence protein ComK [Bacillus sp. REN10]
MEVVPNYNVSTTTMLLKEQHHPDYNTIIHDVLGVYYTKQTVKSMLNEACMERGSTYDGRIQATRVQTRCIRKTPLVICPVEKIYTFPMVSPSNYGCPWCFPVHIIDAEQEENGQLRVAFSNGTFTSIEGSLYTFTKQKERADHTLNHFANKLLRQLRRVQLFI